MLAEIIYKSVKVSTNMHFDSAQFGFSDLSVSSEGLSSLWVLRVIMKHESNISPTPTPQLKHSEN